MLQYILREERKNDVFDLKKNFTTSSPCPSKIYHKLATFIIMSIQGPVRLFKIKFMCITVCVHAQYTCEDQKKTSGNLSYLLPHGNWQSNSGSKLGRKYFWAILLVNNSSYYEQRYLNKLSL